jgi:hypothetical protein
MEMDNRQGSGSLSQSVQIIIISVACIISSSLFFAVGLLCHRYRYCPKQIHELESMQRRETECDTIEHDWECSLWSSSATYPALM